MRAQRERDGQARDPLRRLDAVPRGPDAAGAGLHAGIGDDPARVADGDAGLLRERAVRTYAETEDDHVGGQ